MNPAPALDPQAIVAGAIRHGLAHAPEMLGDIWRATFPALFWIGGGWLWRLNRGALAGAGVALVVTVGRDFGLYAGFVVETLLLVGWSRRAIPDDDVIRFHGVDAGGDEDDC